MEGEVAGGGLAGEAGAGRLDRLWRRRPLQQGQQAFRPDDLLRLRQLSRRPPAMLGDDAALLLRQICLAQAAVGQVDAIVPFLDLGQLAVRLAEDDDAAGDLRAQALAAQAHFLPKLAQRGLLMCLAGLQPAARRQPEGRAGNRTLAIGEAEQEDTAVGIDDQKPCGGSLAHGARP
jgi:hypothetical protein